MMEKIKQRIKQALDLEKAQEWDHEEFREYQEVAKDQEVQDPTKVAVKEDE